MRLIKGQLVAAAGPTNWGFVFIPLAALSSTRRNGRGTTFRNSRQVIREGSRLGEETVMKTCLRGILTAGLGVLVTMGTTALARADEAKASLPAASALQSGPGTFWNFLGIPQGTQKARDARLNRRGNNPQRERVDPLKRIADPENLKSKNPAIAAAAKIKQDQDLAPQKIKAIKYLGSIACCCPTNKDDVKNALLAALDDCTDEVRQAAATAICHAAGNPCAICSQCNCCAADVMNKLNEMANEQDEKGCWKEPNATVRQAAGLALEACRRVRGPEPAPQEAPPPKEEPKERRVPAAPKATDPGYSAPQVQPGKPAPDKDAPKPAPKPTQKSTGAPATDAEGWKVRPASAEESSVGFAVITDQGSKPVAKPQAATKPAEKPMEKPAVKQAVKQETSATTPEKKPESATTAEPKLLPPAKLDESKVSIKLSGTD
jgi:hypothetical protein